jgi:hypothetical protein
LFVPHNYVTHPAPPRTSPPRFARRTHPAASAPERLPPLTPAALSRKAAPPEPPPRLRAACRDAPERARAANPLRPRRPVTPVATRVKPRSSATPPADFASGSTPPLRSGVIPPLSPVSPTPSPVRLSHSGPDEVRHSSGPPLPPDRFRRGPSPALRAPSRRCSPDAARFAARAQPPSSEPSPLTPPRQRFHSAGHQPLARAPMACTHTFKNNYAGHAPGGPHFVRTHSAPSAGAGVMPVREIQKKTQNRPVMPPASTPTAIPKRFYAFGRRRLLPPSR